MATCKSPGGNKPQANTEKALSQVIYSSKVCNNKAEHSVHSNAVGKDLRLYYITGQCKVMIAMLRNTKQCSSLAMLRASDVNFKSC